MESRILSKKEKKFAFPVCEVCGKFYTLHIFNYSHKFSKKNLGELKSILKKNGHNCIDFFSDK